MQKGEIRLVAQEVERFAGTGRRGVTKTSLIFIRSPSENRRSVVTFQMKNRKKKPFPRYREAWVQGEKERRWN